MAQVRDPVCGMLVDPESAAYSTFQGSMYYFCTPECRDLFEANPSRYAAKGAPADSSPTDEEPELEKHEPPFTKKGPIVAPKFGSAGSGGLEFEPGPERHGKKP
ncbi:MAG: YHS domain-containing protein [Gemmatimonadaceae bacterium]